MYLAEVGFRNYRFGSGLPLPSRQKLKIARQLLIGSRIERLAENPYVLPVAYLNRE